MGAKATLSEGTNTISRLTLQRPDGTTIAYRDSGSGQPIMLVHGWGTNGRFFRDQRRALAGTHRVIVPDLRGHGESGPLGESESFRVFADDLAMLIDRLDLENLILVGWSLGAMVAWDLLTRHAPSAVKGLVVVEMVPRLLNDPDWSYGLRDDEGEGEGIFAHALASMRQDWPAFTGVFIPRIYARNGSPRQPDLVRTARAWAMDNDPESMAAAWVALVGQDFRGRVSQIAVPTLIVYGERSQLYDPEASTWLQEQIPDARCIGFPEAGHAPHLEAPDRFTAVLREFSDGLQSVRPAQQGAPAAAGRAKQ